MKRVVILAVLALVALRVEAQVQFEKGSFEKVCRVAAEQEKLLFVDLYAPWCGPCRTMDRQVFVQKGVEEFFAAHFFAVKYNVDLPAGAELMQRYGRGAIPLYLVMKPDGTLLGRIEGMSSAEKLIADLRRIIAVKE